MNQYLLRLTLVVGSTPLIRQWWLSIPKQVGPMPDPTKWNPCLVGLGYPVVMLANPIIGINTPKVTYNCDIPKDRAILVFGITEICPYDPTHKTDEDLRKCVKARNDWAKHQIIIDGKSVENVNQYRFTNRLLYHYLSKGQYGKSSCRHI